MTTNADAEVQAQVAEIVAALRNEQLDHAESRWQRLNAFHPAAGEMLVIPVVMAIKRGRAADALQMLNEHPDDRFPELRALCLNALGDPTWHSHATALEDSPDPHVRLAMSQLLGKHDEAAA